jgi:ABC-2 type transport system permease protein
MRLFFRYVAASIRRQAQYPASTALLALGQFLATGLELVAMWALFDRFGAVNGWHFGEVALFYALVNIQFAIADLLSRGFDVLGTELIRTGAFDRLLLRPRSLTLQLMGHDVRLSRLGRLGQGLVVLLIATAHAPVAWTPVSIGIALWATAGGVALFFGLLVLQGTLAFWTTESLEMANMLTYGGVEAAQYPLAVYARWFRSLLTFVVPLACVAYFPAVAILGKVDPLGSPPWTGALTPVFGFVFLGVSFAAWQWGVRHYTSTGS